MHQHILSGQSPKFPAYPANGVSSVEQYRSCHLRAVVCSRLMGLDQKILHLPPIDGRLMEGKRARFRLASDTFCSNTGVEFGPVAEYADSREELKAMKLSILNALRASGIVPPAEIGWLPVRAAQPDRNRFGYAGEIRRTFSDNLSSVILYGSAVFGTDPGDYDNFVIVRDIERAYQQARDFRAVFLNRPVHLNLIPEDLAKTLFAIAAMPSVRYPWLTVIEGTASLPQIPRQLIFMQGRARAIELIGRRRELLTADDGEVADSILRLPSSGAEAVFGSIAHLPSVMIEWTRRFDQCPDNKPQTKGEILESLRTQGLSVPVFSPEKDELHRQLQSSLEFTQTVLLRSRLND